MENTENIVSYDLVKIRNLFDLLVSCNTEHRFRFSKNGLIIKCVDPANVFMICMEIPKSSFLEYTVEDDMEIGIPTEVILQKLRCAFFNDIYLGDVFSLKFEKEGDKSLIYCMTECYTFVVPELKNVRAEPRVPTIELPFEYEILSEELYNAVKLLDNEDSILFDGSIIQQHVDRPDFGNIQNNVYHPASLNVIKNEGNACTLATREYLINFLKPLRDVCKNVTVCIGVEFPVVVTGAGHSDEIIKILLAPRIEHS